MSALRSLQPAMLGKHTQSPPPSGGAEGATHQRHLESTHTMVSPADHEGYLQAQKAAM